MAENALLVKITSDISNLQTGLNQAKAGLQSFGNIGNTVMGQLTAVAGSVGIALASNQAIESFKTWESGLIDIGTQLGKLRESSLPLFAEGIKNLSIASGTSLQSLSKGMADIVDRGIQVGNELQALDRINRLSITTNSEFQSALSAVDVVMKQFGSSAGNFNEVIDKVFETTRQGTLDMGEFTTFIRRVGTVANGVGVQFNELAGITAFLTEKQVPARVAMQALTSVMQDLNNLSPERIALFKQEGIAIDENTVREKGLAGAMVELSKLSDEALQKIMPNIRNREVLSLITNNLAEVEKKRMEIEKSAGVVDAEYAKRQETLEQMTKQLQRSFEVLTTEALTPLVPILKSLVEKTTQTIKGIREWAEENPKLYENLVKTVAIIGTAITVLTTLALTVNSVTVAFNALGITSVGSLVKMGGALETVALKTLYFGDAVKVAIVSLQGMGLVAGGLLVGAIVALVAEVVIITKGIWDWVKANEQLKASYKGFAETIKLNTANMVATMDELITKYQDLTEEELLRIEAIKLEAKAMDDKVKIAMEDKKLTEEEQKVLRDSVLELKAHTIAVENEVNAREHQKTAIEGVNDSEDEFQAKMKASEIVEKEKEARLDAIVLKYLDLAKAYEAGTIKQEEFRAKLSQFVLEGQAVTGSIDDIANKLRTVAETDFSISLKIRLETMDVVNSMKEKLLQAQEDLVLNHAQGEEKKRMQIEITERRALRAIAVEMEAQKMKYTEEMRQIDAVAQSDIANAEYRRIALSMSFEEYIKYREGLWNADREKQEALFKVQKDIQAELMEIIKDNAQYELDLMDGKVGEHEKLNEKYRDRLKLLEEEKYKIQEVLGASAGSVQPPTAPTPSSGGGGGGGGGESALPYSLIGGVREYQKAPAFGEVPMGQPYRILGGYAEGTRYVPMTGIYQLHRGERVIPADENKGGGSPTVTVVTLLDPKLIPEVMAQYPNAILNVINSDILRNGLTRRTIKSIK